jgi:hypothetical protein
MKKKVFLVLVAALTALPIFAEQKNPTATPKPSAERGKPTKEQREVAPGGPDTATRGKPSKEQRQMTGKVTSQSSNTFTIMANGKEFTFSAARLKTLPKVGDVVDITYTQTPGGPMEATTVKGSKSNSDN